MVKTSYKRKRGGRSRAGAGRRKYARTSAPQRAIRTISRAQIFPVVRHNSVAYSLIGNDVTAPTGYGGGLTFGLTQMPNYTEFTQLFDRYKISGISYRWVLNRDPMVNTTKVYPVVRWVYDYDDATTPADLQTLQQYPRMKEFWFGDSRQASRWYFFRPSHLMVGYESATNSSYTPVWKGFLDCASDTAPHYGIKYWYQRGFTGSDVTLEVKFYMVFKNIR